MNNFLSISDIFHKHLHPAMAKIESGGIDEDALKSAATVLKLSGDTTYYYPVLIGSTLTTVCGWNHTPEMVNIATCFYLWRQAPLSKRNIYRCTLSTAKYLQSVNLTFLPEEPPQSWANGAFILESFDKRVGMIQDVFSMAVYRTMDRDRRMRYFFFLLDINGGASVFSIATDLQKLNHKMLETNIVLNESMETELGFSGERFIKSLPIIKFAFAASYYVAQPQDHSNVEIKTSPGPIERRGKKKKALRIKGQIQPYWSYRTVNRIESESAEVADRGSLDKEHLVLDPVIVGPHIRRQGDRVIFIDPYDSHRWKRKDGGTKIKI